MNANIFWRNQAKKNKTGKPQYTVSTDPNTPEEEFMRAWIDKWHKHFSYLDNKGCGCCVNIYEFDAPPEAIAEIPDDLIDSYEEIHRPLRTGSPSSFREFNRPVEKLNRSSE